MKRTISVILMSAVIGTTVASAVVLNPMDVFAEGSNKPVDDKKKTPFEEGKDYGEKTGEPQGELKGKKDALDGKSFDWQSAYSSLGNIDDIFNIGRDGEYTNGFRQGFLKGFENGYGNGYMDALIEEVERDVIEDVAEEMGEQDATSDYYNDLKIDIDRHRLTDEEIIERFLLTDGDSLEYEEYFIVLYRTKYEDTYRKKYRELRKDNFDIDAKKGYEDGKNIGGKMGEYSGKFDFVTPNAPNDWESSFRKFEEQKSIADRYFLDRETEQYKQSFITAFKEAYRIKYTEAYRSLNIDISENNINYVKVAGKAESLAFKPSDGVGNLGGTLKIENATFYEETHLGISMDRDSFNYNKLKYKPVNHVYNVAVENRGEGIKLDKPMTLELEYYGSERAGIYQLINDEWVYMYTHVSDKSIMDDKGSGDEETLVNENSSSDSKEDLFLRAEIPAGMFKGGKYAIFIDEDYKPIKDIRRHWANEELYTFLRRGYIKGDKHTNYYPNAAMFRGEFLDVLGKAMGWDYEGVYDDTSRFKDKNEFYGYKNAINYAANMGYVSGGTDGRFRPYDTITYNQVEWILKKVLYDGDFKWNSYEEQIRHDKFTNPESVKGKNKPIKRGEAIYMLHKIQQHNLI